MATNNAVVRISNRAKIQPRIVESTKDRLMEAREEYDCASPQGLIIEQAVRQEIQGSNTPELTETVNDLIEVISTSHPESLEVAKIKNSQPVSERHITTRSEWEEARNNCRLNTVSTHVSREVHQLLKADDRTLSVAVNQALDAYFAGGRNGFDTVRDKLQELTTNLSDEEISDEVEYLESFENKYEDDREVDRSLVLEYGSELKETQYARVPVLLGVVRNEDGMSLDEMKELIEDAFDVSDPTIEKYVCKAKKYYGFDESDNTFKSRADVSESQAQQVYDAMMSYYETGMDALDTSFLTNQNTRTARNKMDKLTVEEIGMDLLVQKVGGERLIVHINNWRADLVREYVSSVDNSDLDLPQIDPDDYNVDI